MDSLSDARYLAGVVSCNPDTVGEDLHLTWSDCLILVGIRSDPTDRPHIASTYSATTVRMKIGRYEKR